ncbi:MAG: cysteine-rich CWC family protein, partial [Candidatus Dormibacteraceae bacterium]
MSSDGATEVAAAGGGQPIPGDLKSCKVCDGAFPCAQGKPGCWCEAVVVRKETRARISALTDDCVCPTCLSDFAGPERVTG